MSTSEKELRSFSILVAALGGEGGGILTDWIVQAISSAGYHVQSTSIPGVAQRTGGTTYYVEFFPVPLAELGKRRPALALMPIPGHVDVLLASELIEAARAIQNGFVTTDRTTLVASSHRVYAIEEKSAMADGRFDDAAAMKACHDFAKRAVVFDMDKVSEKAGTVISAVLLGGLAGSGAVPIDPERFKDVIKASGRAVEANLRGFDLGFKAAAGMDIGLSDEESATRRSNGSERGPEDLIAHIRREWPVETHFIGTQALARLNDYQDKAYAELYLKRMAPIIELDRESHGSDHGWKLTIETGRYLALRMSYEDVIRVADLKTRQSRFARIRREALAKQHEPIKVTEYLKPGAEEICAVLPPRLGERFLAFVRRRGIEHRLNVGVYIRSDTISGFALLRIMAGLRFLRRSSWRFAQETRQIESWLGLVLRSAQVSYRLGVEVAESANLIKGYSGTYRRGVRNYELLIAEIVEPAIGANDPSAASDVARARRAALADPEGDALDRTLQEVKESRASHATSMLLAGE